MVSKFPLHLPATLYKHGSFIGGELMHSIQGNGGYGLGPVACQIASHLVVGFNTGRGSNC